MEAKIKWVNEIFRRFEMIYGSSKFNVFCLERSRNDMINYWANELKNITAESIGYAMEHLPEQRIPSLIEFLNLCIARPSQEQQLTFIDKAKPEVVAKVLQGLNKPTAKAFTTPDGSKTVPAMVAWAHKKVMQPRRMSNELEYAIRALKNVRLFGCGYEPIIEALKQGKKAAA